MFRNSGEKRKKSKYDIKAAIQILIMITAEVNLGFLGMPRPSTRNEVKVIQRKKSPSGQFLPFFSIFISYATKTV